MSDTVRIIRVGITVCSEDHGNPLDDDETVNRVADVIREALDAWWTRPIAKTLLHIEPDVSN